MSTRHPTSRHGFTIVEIMVTVGIVGALLAILLPTLGTIRESSGETKCGSNLRQLSSATIAYLSTWDNNLPQVAVPVSFPPDPGNPGSGPPPGASLQIMGALFAGKRGELPMFGINEYGINSRPLNPYLTGGKKQIEDNESAEMIDEYIPVCECPLDRGQKPNPHGSFIPQAESLHRLLGCSYTLNDHSLDGDAECTLVPRASGGKPGGRMPLVDDPSKTWMLGDHPIYNYQENGDRGQRWHFGDVRVNLAFVDGHIGMGIDIVKGARNTTQHYTFLPQHDWECGD
jgi:prepilin-type N-terminal cleavage/methylation domain-containing protein/prepilin-type processing-associated H-X9-DG protein